MSEQSWKSKQAPVKEEPANGGEFLRRDMSPEAERLGQGVAENRDPRSPKTTTKKQVLIQSRSSFSPSFSSFSRRPAQCSTPGRPTLRLAQGDRGGGGEAGEGFEGPAKDRGLSSLGNGEPWQVLEPRRTGQDWGLTGPLGPQ